MANPYSILHNYDDVPLFQRDFQLINGVLQAKEGALQQSRSALQSEVNRLESLDILKGVDQEYASQRLQAVVDIANKYAGMDLSDPALAGSLLSTVNQTLDKNVKNALYSTKIYRSEQDAWEKLKTEKPDKYADVNYMYAQQFAQPYLNSQKVGDVYSGGAGARGFIDVNGDIQKTIINVAKQLELEYIQDGTGSGYFRSTKTKKVVDRGMLESAIEAQISPKMKEQLKINAWGQFDQLDESTVKTMYEGYLQPRIESAKESIESMRAVANAEKDPMKRDKLLEEVTKAETRLGTYQSSAFEKVGKVGAYNEMYYSQFKDNFLNAYSYEPITIKEEVNALDLANFNAKTKLEDQALAREKFDFNKLDKDRNFLLKVEKAKNSTSKGKARTDDQENILPDLVQAKESGEEVDYIEKGAQKNTDYILEREKQATDGFRKVLEGSGVPPSLINSKELTAAVRNYNGENVITVKKDGKTYSIKVNNKAAVNSFRDEVLTDTPAKKSAYKAIDNTANVIIDKISKSAAKGGDWNPSTELTNFNVMLVADPNNPGKLISKKVDKTKVNNYYASLVYKKGQGKELSDSEKANLQLYTKMSMLADRSVSRTERQLIFNNIQSTILSRTNDKENLLPKNWYAAYNRSATKKVEVDSRLDMNLLSEVGVISYTDRSGKYKADNTGTIKVYDRGLPGIKPSIMGDYNNELLEIQDLAKRAKAGDRRAADQLAVAKTALINKASFASRDNIYDDMSNLTAGELEWSTFGNFKKGIGDELEDRIGTMSSNLEQELGKYNLNPSRQVYAYDPEKHKEQHKDLLIHLGASKDRFPGVLRLVPRLENGVPTGDYDIITEVKTSEKDDNDAPIYAEKLVGVLSEKDARTKFGLIAEKGNRTQYNATFGAEAPVVKIGTTSAKGISGDNLRYIAAKTGTTELPLDNLKPIIDYGKSLGLEDFVAQYVVMAKQGEFTFKLQSNGESYDRVMYDSQGNEVDRVPTNLTEITPDQLVEMQATSAYDNQAAFKIILNELVESEYHRRLANSRR